MLCTLKKNNNSQKMILDVMSCSDINRTLYEKYLFTFKVIIEYDSNLDAVPTQTAFRIPFPD